MSTVAICSLVGCGNKEDTKIENENNEIVSQTPQNEETENNGIVGTWIVEKNVAYEGPMKEIAEQALNIFYYNGSEHEFTEDGTFKSADEKIITKYEVLSDNKISCVTINNGETVIYDYELNGDEFILYGNYTGDYAHLGHSNAVYFKRKR